MVIVASAVADPEPQPSGVVGVGVGVPVLAGPAVVGGLGLGHGAILG